MKLKEIRAFPTWLVVRAIIPFLPNSHAWSDKEFTISEWAAGQTEDCTYFDWIFWITIPMTLFAFCKIL